MHNLLSSKKAQFFILSAVAIVSTIFLVSQWIEPYTIVDTSFIPMREEFFIFNNIVEKANETVVLSKDCEDLNFSLEEYKIFVEKFASSKALSLNFSYVVVSCDSSRARVAFDISLSSPVLELKRKFEANKLF